MTTQSERNFALPSSCFLSFQFERNMKFMRVKEMWTCSGINRESRGFSYRLFYFNRCPSNFAISDNNKVQPSAINMIKEN